jgi:antitoxin ParD1/3/4
MSKTIEIMLDEHCTLAVQNALTSGKYKNAVAVVHEAIALFEQKQAEETLMAELQKGIDSGFVEDFDFKQWLAEKNKKHSF